MIDIAFVRERTTRLREVLKQKQVEADLDRLLILDHRRRELEQEIGDVNRERKATARAKNIEQGKALKVKLAALEGEMAALQPEYTTLLEALPNIPSDDTPVGLDDGQNVVLRTVGEPTTFSFPAKDHVTLAEALGLIDIERAAKVSGTRFFYLQGDLVKMEFAIVQWVLSLLTDESFLAGIIKKNNLTVSPRPFLPIVPPVIVRTESMARMARLEPREERYLLPEDDQVLVGSAEHALGSMHMDECFAESDLPKRYIGFSSAFRREAGSYGKDTRGMLRVHQFDKLEMESFTVAGEGIAEQDFFVAIQEELMQALKLPYRIVICCTGDMGGPDARHIDLETWMPGEGKYRETHSADYMTDYQARRLATRVKLAGGTEFVHMNDATALAIGRTLVAILENYQNEDGSIRVPDILQPFIGQHTIT